MAWLTKGWRHDWGTRLFRKLGARKTRGNRERREIADELTSEAENLDLYNPSPGWWLDVTPGEAEEDEHPYIIDPDPENMYDEDQMRDPTMVEVYEGVWIRRFCNRCGRARPCRRHDPH